MLLGGACSTRWDQTYFRAKLYYVKVGQTDFVFNMHITLMSLSFVKICLKSETVPFKSSTRVEVKIHLNQVVVSNWIQLAD